MNLRKTTTARQFWIRSPGQGEIVTAALGPRQDHEVLVEALFSSVSRGSESLVFRGEVPQSEYRSMRAPFQEGEFPAPVKYGYSSVGEVIEGPESLVGRVVFCLFPHQDVYCVPAAAVSRVPDGVPPGRAVLAANMETAINAVWDGRPGPGDRVVVVGAGVVGLLTAWLCRQLPGTEVTVVDIDPGRASASQALGLHLTSTAPPEACADLVVHASGQPDGLRTALRVAALESTIVELSWYGSRPVSAHLGESFHARRLTLRSSQVGRIPSERAPRWDATRRRALALELLREPSLDALISGESDFEDLPRTLEELSRSPVGVLCHRVRYSRS